MTSSPPPDQPGDHDPPDRDDSQTRRSGAAASAEGAAGPDRDAGDPAESLTIADLTEAIMELGRTVTELAADVEDLQARKAAGGPWWNTDALNPGDVERLRVTVIAFGDHLKAVYAITALPHRWEDDPALLAELTALYVGWIGAYREPRASATQPLQWHEALARSIDRIRAYQDRRRQHDSVHRDTQPLPPLPVAFIPEPATGN